MQQTYASASLSLDCNAFLLLPTVGKILSSLVSSFGEKMYELQCDLFNALEKLNFNFLSLN